MALFRRSTSPAKIPLQLPQPGLLPVPDFLALRRHGDDTRRFTSAAEDVALTDQVMDEARPLANRLADRFLPDSWDATQRNQATMLLHGAICLGMGFATVEAQQAAPQPGMADARIWNAVIFAAQNLSCELPGDLQAMIFWVVQVGYYYGRTGEFYLDVAATSPR
jgi:hypothetical protein